MRQQMTIEMDDGTTFYVEADGRDVRAWEAQYGRSWFAERLSFTNLAQVAYIAGRRTGVLNGAWSTYEDFDAHCVDATGRTEEPLVADPTRAGRTDGSSVRSRSASTSRPRNLKAKADK
jgi:hypothetical protein